MIRAQTNSLAHRRSLELQELDDSSLVAQFLGGEKRAFNELVRRYHVRLLNFIYRTIGDRDRAEDLVQETFVRVYRHLHRFDQTKKFSTWAYTIAGNLAKNELRNRSRNPLVLFQTIKKYWEADHRPLQFEDAGARPDDLYRKRYLKEVVDQCVGQLPAHHRAVFVLREVEGLSTFEVAECLGVSEDVVKTRLSRARATLRRLLMERTGATAPDAFRFYRPRCDRVVAKVLATIATQPPSLA